MLQTHIHRDLRCQHAFFLSAGNCPNGCRQLTAQVLPQDFSARLHTQHNGRTKSIISFDAKPMWSITTACCLCRVEFGPMGACNA